MKRCDKDAKPPSVDALCEQHRNEEPHARHVAALALKLFDATQTTFNLRKRDRRLLETAARLHDIGYATRPDDHVTAGVEIVRTSGLRGFSSRQAEDIASIIALHGTLPDAQTAGRMLERIEKPERIFQLGAILRVADALDHGHLQETRITAIDKLDEMVRVRVSAPRGSFSVERAIAKSDLWQRVFPLGISFDARYYMPAAEPKSQTPAGVAIRRLMLTQFRVFRASLRRAAREDDAEALHDLRIAVRSMRRLLQAFERPLRKTSAAQVEKALRAFAKRLGPTRDIDVWITLLKRPRYREALAGASDYIEAQEQERRRAYAELREEFEGEFTRKLLVSLGFLLRIELLQVAPRVNRPFGRLARRCVKDAWKNAMAKRRWALCRDSKTLHALRVRVRKLRLLASLTAPALPPAAEFMIATVRDLERHLGRIHDLDEALRRASRTGAPAAFIAALARRRRKELRRFRAAWENFDDRKVKRRCREAWK